jgi:uncharacterized membrane protein
MGYALLKFLHILGAVLIGAGLIGVWLSDLRSRQVRELSQFAEAVRYIAVFYDGVVVPGALLLLASGAWLMGRYLGGWESLRMPWLAGMVALFAFEFIEGNTITRLYFMRLRRMTREALRIGRFTPELEHERAKTLPSFTHFLDLPILFVIIALGALRPETWDLFLIGSFVAITIAAALTVYIQRFYPWSGPRTG